MVVISKLDLGGKDITKYNNATIKNINLNGVNYHFAKQNEVTDGICENAVNEPIIDMQLSGNSVQESENLFDKTKMQIGFLPQSGTYPTVNSSYPDTSYQIIDIKAGQTVNITYTGSNSSQGRIRCIDKDTDTVIGPILQSTTDNYYISTVSQNNGFRDGKITAKKDFKLGFMFLNVLPSDFNLQVISLTPTTEAPSEIQSVGERTKNIADVSKAIPPSTTPYVTYNYDIKTGTIEYTNTPTEYDYLMIYLERDIGFKFELGKTYYFGAVATVSGKQTTNETRIRFGIDTSADDYFIELQAKENGQYVLRNSFVYTGQETIRLLVHANIGSPEPAKVKFENIYVSEVDKFEHYGYKVPVKLSGKNLFYTKNITYPFTTSGVTVSYDPHTQIYTFNGTSTSSADIYTIPSTTEILNIKQNETYCMRVYNVGGTTTGEPTNLRAGINDKAWSGGILCGIGSPIIKTFSQDTIITRMYFYLQGQGIVFNNYQLKVQLEKGNKATEFEPYVSPITTNIYLNEPLRKVGDYADYIDYKNKKVVRNIKEVNMASLNWSYNTANTVFASKIEDGITMSTLKTNNALCSHYSLYIGAFTEMVDGQFQNPSNYWSSYNYVVVRDTRYTVSTEFKNYLKEIGAILHYILETPTEETIDIPTIETLDGTTIFDAETTIESSAMKINYWKQI